MLRWMALGTFFAMGSAVLWGIAAYSIDSTWLRISFTVAGVFASAWIVPIWWLVNLVLYFIGRGLSHVRRSLLGDEQAAELYFSEIRERGTSWVLVATEWGMQKYDAPPIVQVAIPEVVTYISPLFDQPLQAGLDEMRQDTISRLSRWQQRTQIIRNIWAGLCFTPLWGGCLLVSLL